MANYGYGWYTQEQLEDYYDQLIGNIFNIPSNSSESIKSHFSLLLHLFRFWQQNVR